MKVKVSCIFVFDI